MSHGFVALVLQTQSSVLHWPDQVTKTLHRELDQDCTRSPGFVVLPRLDRRNKRPVPRCLRAGCRRDRLDLNRFRAFRLLEGAGHPTLGSGCRSSLVDRAASHPIRRILFSVSLSARPIARGLRCAWRNWRYYRGAHRGNASFHFPVPPTADDFASLERVWVDRHRLRRFFRAKIWIKRLAINGAVTRTPAQPITHLSRAFNYRFARFDLCPACQAWHYLDSHAARHWHWWNFL